MIFMAKKKNFNVEIIGLRRAVKGINFLVKDLKNPDVIPMVSLLNDMREDMRNVIRPWSFSGELINSLVISNPRKTKDGFRTSLRSTAPYAGALERGVKPHFVYAGQGTKMYNWLQRYHPSWNYYSDKGAWFHVGGGTVVRHSPKNRNEFFTTNTTTYIKSRESKRQFFGPVLRDRVARNDFKRFGLRGVKNAVNNFSRRTANAKDRIKIITR